MNQPIRAKQAYRVSTMMWHDTTFNRALESIIRKRQSFLRNCLIFAIVNRANWLWNSASFLLKVFVLYFFCSLALTVHKTQKVFKYIWTTNQSKDLDLDIGQNSVHRPRFVQPKTKQLCTLLLKFFGFHNQFALLTMVFPIFRHTNQNNQSERFLVLQEEELERQRSHNVNKNTWKSTKKWLNECLRRVAKQLED